MASCDEGVRKNVPFKFFGGEDRTLNIHLEEVNESTGLVQSFDLSDYDSSPGKVELKIPGVTALQLATVLGNPVDGNISFDFTSVLTADATSGYIDGILTSTTGKVRKFRSLQRVEKQG